MFVSIVYISISVNHEYSSLDVWGKKHYTDKDQKNKWNNNMVASCELTGKGKQFGHNVSFSLRRTKRVFKPNLQKKTFEIDGQKITMVLSTNAIRTLKKKGILA